MLLGSCVRSVLQEVGSLQNQRFGGKAGEKAKDCGHVLVVNTVKVDLELGIVDSGAVVQRCNKPGPARCRLQLWGVSSGSMEICCQFEFIFFSKPLTSFQNRLPRPAVHAAVVQPRKSGQDLALGLVAPRQVCTDPPLHPDEVPLGRSRPSGMSTPGLLRVYSMPRSASLTTVLKDTGPSMDPWGTPLVTGHHLDVDPLTARLYSLYFAISMRPLPIPSD